MKSCFILLLLIGSLITSCQEPPINETRAYQMTIEYSRKGWIKYKADSLKLSLDYYNLASIYANPKDTVEYAGILFMKYHIFKGMNKVDSAICYLEQYLSILPAKLKDLQDLAFLYGEAKRFKEGLAILEKVRKIDSLNPVIYSDMAHYSVEIGMYDHAIEYTERGLKLTHDSILIGALLNDLGYGQAKLTSDSIGLVTVENAIRFSPQNPGAYFNKGRIYRDMGEKEEELRCFKQMDSLDNITRAEIKVSSNFIRPEIERSYGWERGAPGRPGRLTVAFEEGFSDSAIVLVNNRIVFRDRLKSSGSGSCNKRVEVDYTGYKDLPRITVTLINQRESMFFYPVRGRRVAYINYDIDGLWRVLLSNNSHIYW